MALTRFIYFSDNEGLAIGFEDTAFIFAIYVAGFTVVITSLIIEIIIKCFRKTYHLGHK